MKKIEAIIKPFKLDEVRAALGEAGIEGMTVSDVKGFGRHNVQLHQYRGTEFEVACLPKLKIELVLPDNRLAGALAAIMKGTDRTKPGNDKVFVSNIEEASATA